MSVSSTLVRSTWRLGYACLLVLLGVMLLPASAPSVSAHPVSKAAPQALNPDKAYLIVPRNRPQQPVYWYSSNKDDSQFRVREKPGEKMMKKDVGAWFALVLIPGGGVVVDTYKIFLLNPSRGGQSWVRADSSHVYLDTEANATKFRLMPRANGSYALEFTTQSVRGEFRSEYISSSLYSWRVFPGVAAQRGADYMIQDWNLVEVVQEKAGAECPGLLSIISSSNIYSERIANTLYGRVELRRCDTPNGALVQAFVITTDARDYVKGTVFLDQTSSSGQYLQAEDDHPLGVFMAATPYFPIQASNQACAILTSSGAWQAGSACTENYIP
ncbi:MAG TPA: hypothetical protein VKR06_34915 [Ktedonosporobacter sp.]|nr:hypothetical protein [Ktedonosporobacter sp.]